MTLFNITHATGEFLARTELDEFKAAEMIGERWDLDVEDIHEATEEDIRIAEGQVTDLDHDA